MYYADVLKHKVYALSGRFYDQKNLLERMPWGEVDWQSGIERWIVTWHALFEGKHDISTNPTRVPEAHLFIDARSIDIEEATVCFQAIVIFKYNYYYTDNLIFKYLDDPKYPRNGFFSNNFSNQIVGDFNVLNEIDPSELVSWIHDLNSNSESP